MREATVVHHAFPCEYYPEYEWEDDNLISLCVKCHNAMHDRDSHELTQLGIEWKDRVSPLLQLIKTDFEKTGGKDHFQ